jgi:hypothetical protein
MRAIDTFVIRRTSVLFTWLIIYSSECWFFFGLIRNPDWLTGTGVHWLSAKWISNKREETGRGEYLPVPASAWTLRRSAVVLPANMGPTMTWISPDCASRASIAWPRPSIQVLAAAAAGAFLESDLAGGARGLGREWSGRKGSERSGRRAVARGRKAGEEGAERRSDLMAEEMERIREGFIWVVFSGG